MRELVVVPHKELADLLVEALRRADIIAALQPQGAAWQISVSDEDFAQAQRLLDTFRADPRRLNQVAWQDSHPLRAKPSLAGMTVGLRRFGPLTQLVLGVCILIYLSRFVVGDRVYLALLMPDQLGALASQPWRLFTPALLHFSILHIAFDLIWWLELGGQVERMQSSRRLLWLALVVAALSDLAQFLVTGPMFGGLSGVVYGLLGYVWVQGRLRPASGLFIQNNIVIFMLVWLVLCWTGWLGAVANMAHLVGLLTGSLMGWLAATRAGSRDTI